MKLIYFLVLMNKKTNIGLDYGYIGAAKHLHEL